MHKVQQTKAMCFSRKYNHYLTSIDWYIIDIVMQVPSVGRAGLTGPHAPPRAEQDCKNDRGPAKTRLRLLWTTAVRENLMMSGRTQDRHVSCVLLYKGIYYAEQLMGLVKKIYQVVLTFATDYRACNEIQCMLFAIVLNISK